MQLDSTTIGIIIVVVAAIYIGFSFFGEKGK